MNNPAWTVPELFRFVRGSLLNGDSQGTLRFGTVIRDLCRAHLPRGFANIFNVGRGEPAISSHGSNQVTVLPALSQLPEPALIERSAKSRKIA